VVLTSAESACGWARQEILPKGRQCLGFLQRDWSHSLGCQPSCPSAGIDWP
jgi:hypothetical protein